MDNEEILQEAVESSVDEPSDTPLVVVSVDELLERLTASGVDEVEEPTEEEALPEETELSLSEQWYLMALDDTSGDQTVRLLTEIRDVLPDDHPLLTTRFEDYTVAEGLLLSLLLCVVGSWCVRMLKGGFSWLLS